MNKTEARRRRQEREAQLDAAVARAEAAMAAWLGTITRPPEDDPWLRDAYEGLRVAAGLALPSKEGEQDFNHWFIAHGRAMRRFDTWAMESTSYARIVSDPRPLAEDPDDVGTWLGRL